MKKIILILIFASLLSNCASPKLTNWDKGNYDYYDNAGYLYKRNLHEKANNTAKPLNHPVLNVSVAAVPIPKQARIINETKKFTDFSEKVQLAIIKTLTYKGVSNKAIIDALKADYSEPEKVTPSTNKDYTDIKLRLYFSNVKRYFNDARLMNPNTRLAFLNTKVKIQNGSNMMFQSVDKLENEFESIDMGKLERTQDVNFNSKLSGNITGNVSTENSSGNTRNTGSVTEVKSYDADGNEISTTTTSTNNANNGYSDDNYTNSNSNGITSTNNSSNTGSNNTTNTNTNTSSGTKTNSNSAKGQFGGGANASAELDIKNSIKEAIGVNFKRLKTGFSLNKKSLVVSQQGSLLRDVNDVTILTVSFEFKNDAKKKESVLELSNMFDVNGQPNSIDKLKHTISTILYYPCNSKDISDQKITYSYEGAIRAPKNLKKSNNILEYDDKVNYFAFDSNCLEPLDCNGNEIENMNTLDISKFTFCKQVFRVKVKNKKTQEVTELLLAVNGDTFVPHFEGKNAYEFVDWLKAVGGMKAGLYKKGALLEFFIYDGKPKQIDPKDYDFELEDIDRSLGKFVVNQMKKDSTFQFSLKDPKGTIILTSRGFKTAADYKKDIQYIKDNSQKDILYESNSTETNKYYFNLIAADGSITGTSDAYESAAARDNAIEYIKRIMYDAVVEDPK